MLNIKSGVFFLIPNPDKRDFLQRAFSLSAIS
jgi:hypothetical protein